MSDKTREQFEAKFGAPPYEEDLDRFPDDEKQVAWPGQYKDINVQRAWEAWQASRAQALNEAAQVCDSFYGRNKEAAAKNNGRQSDFAFGASGVSIEIASAIRNLGPVRGGMEP